MSRKAKNKLESKNFLEQCKGSTQGAYSCFKSLLAHFEESGPACEDALKFWHNMAEDLTQVYSSQEMLELFHFSVTRLSLRQEGGQNLSLILLQLPSTFAPEEWSFTFYEGLARFKTAEFQDKTVAELGSGTGWITLALAKQCKVKKIYGLEINPKAVLCAKINLYTNAFDKNGAPSWTYEGKTLIDVVEFHESDLLDYCKTKGILLDRVIGCIPQVLNPDPEFTLRMQAKKSLEQANDDFLYSLSNYTVDQGYLEDQFGLGLIARSVEESATVLKQSGKVILNLGGRPGEAVLNQLFLRRGFRVHPVWRTKVNQAKDTDIRCLVDIEEKTQHRFEFFMGQGNDIPISAKTALAYAEAGGSIAHQLTVFEAEPKDPVHLPKMIQLLLQPGYKDSRNSLDLSFSEDSLTVEKTSFLAGMIEHIQAGDFFPYEETKGLHDLREKLTTFFHRYFRVPFDFESFLICPSRKVICENILHLYKPKEILLDSELAQALENHPGILEIPKSSDILCELLEKRRPDIAIYSIPVHEAQNSDSFIRIIQTAEQSSTRIFLDISELVELSSTPNSNGIFRYLSKNPLPLHVSLICGLVKNRLYRDLEVCFLISENKDLLRNLEFSAELTYSRTPVISQLYYDRILHDLISFQLTEKEMGKSKTTRSLLNESIPYKRKFIPLSHSAESAFSHSAIAGEEIARQPNLIRLDYGENALPTPHALKQSIFEAFCKKTLTSEDSSCDREILQMIQNRFKIRSDSRTQIVYGCGIAPLFSKLVEICTSIQGTLFHPSGSYGHFVASGEFFGVNRVQVPTQEENQFKLEASHLDQALSDSKLPKWVFLNAPLVNPTGAIYSKQELESIFEVIQKHQGLLILDSIFSGLEFNEINPEKIPDLRLFPGLKWVILGGLSKEFAAGGLRVGYLATFSEELIRLLSSFPSTAPHPALKFALKQTYSLLHRKEPHLIAQLNTQRITLRERAETLSKILIEIGWKPLPTQGGLFLCAKPSSKVTPEHMLEKAGVVINPPSWTGISNYYRFVLSVSNAQFGRAIEQIRTKLAF